MTFCCHPDLIYVLCIHKFGQITKFQLNKLAKLPLKLPELASEKIGVAVDACFFPVAEKRQVPDMSCHDFEEIKLIPEDYFFFGGWR